jgi:hypothetical protein
MTDDMHQPHAFGSGGKARLSRAEKVPLIQAKY